MWRALLYMPVATPPSCPASAAGLAGFGTIECSTQIAGRLRPHHLPEIPNFEEWTSNTSVPLVGGDQVVHVARGDMAHLGVSRSSRFYVLPALVSREEVQSILALVNGSDAPVLDADPDSVDGMTSHEIFVDNDELRAMNNVSALNIAANKGYVKIAEVLLNHGAEGAEFLAEIEKYVGREP